jgi:glycosyltransferase involved in cell wall biosynthesis
MKNQRKESFEQVFMKSEPLNTAYILLWFPKPSETFVYREVVNLRSMGLPLNVFTLYGRLKDFLSPEMEDVTGVKRLGTASFVEISRSFLYWLKEKRKISCRLLRTIPLRKWRSFEVAGENIWAFFSGFYLAILFEKQGIEHIHAPWANGPATAAWVASELTGIPFSFTGRAVDIRPSDGALEEKLSACTFVRTNTLSNVRYLKKYLKEDKKIYLTYNGYPLTSFCKAAVSMTPPYQILAMGRFARFKGYGTLLKAMGVLKGRGVDFHLVLAGDGPKKLFYKLACRCMGIQNQVSFPGFISHDRVSAFYNNADLFVMPSVVHRTGEQDGIPNVVMEALLHRLPVVATSLPAMQEVIKSGESGLLVFPNDPAALAGAIEKMLKNRSASLKMAEQGHTKVLNMFDPEKNHQKIFDLYKSMFIKDS